VGTRAIYRADQDANDVFELFSVELAGGSAVRLNAAGKSCASDYRVTPDGQHVVYQADEDGDGLSALYAAPSDASAPGIQISPSFRPGLSAVDFELSPLSERVVYADDPDQDTIVTLFSCAIAGGAAQPLDATDAGMLFGRFELTSDGARVVY